MPGRTRQLVELEDLADQQPHVDDPDRVERERQVVAARDDLEGPVVGCNGGHVAVAEPGEGVPPETGLVALDEAIPRPPRGGSVRGGPSATSSTSPLPDFDALRGEGRLELGHRDVVVGRERLDAELGGHIGQNASADDPVPKHGDVVSLGALGTDERAVAAVVHAVLVEDVRQRVPLGRRLQRHDDHVVGEAVALDAVGGLPARLHVGSGRHHRALRVEPVRRLELRRVRLEVDSQREGLAASDAARRLADASPA